MQQYRYYLTDQMGTLAAEPLGESDFVINWSEEVDGSLRMYSKTFDGNITFTGNVYRQLLKMEKSIYRCNLQYLSIEKNCGDGFNSIFEGSISLNSGEWDEDKCSVKLKFTEENEASCLSENDNVEFNLLSLFPKYQLNTRPGNMTLEYEECYDTDTLINDVPAFDPYWCGADQPWDSYWDYYYHREDLQRENDGGIERWNRSRRTNWVREVLNVEIGTDPGDDSWHFIGTVAGKDKYARPVSMFNFRSDEQNPSPGFIIRTIEQDFVGKTNSSLSLRNGIKLSDAIIYMVGELCPGLNVRSDFFQINPEFPSTVNYVTGKRSKVMDLFLFQASDVKRPTANAMASKLMLDWDRLTNALKYIFNVDWRVQDNLLSLEHVSYFPRNIGFDVTTEPYKKWLSGKKAYTYKNEDLPNKEEWNWATKQSNGDFQGVPIQYNSGCIVNKRVVKTYNIEDFVTDVSLALANPASDNKTIDDESIFLVAGAYDGAAWYILQEQGILSPPNINNTLALAMLHRDYFQFERPLPVGIMNGVETIFTTTLPTKQGVPFKIPVCCPNTFNPDNLVKTPLGLGKVNSAIYSFKDSMLELELLYDSFSDLVPNIEPVAVFDVVNTYDQSEIIIDVLANDTYEPGDTVEIVDMPSVGVAEVMPDGNIKFSVNLGNPSEVVTFLNYRIRDNVWGVYSNVARVTITILKANEPPVANTDSYQAVKDQTLIIAAAQGVLANDTDDYGGLFIADYDNLSANGGSIVMEINGAFNYTPAAGFTGSDSFTYVVEDNGGLQDTGTVNLAVNQENVPITRNDIYQVQIGQSLVIDNSTFKRNLLYNDYTLDSSPFTANPETKSTSLGSTVNILSTGNFDYSGLSTPGNDSFDYTAIGVGGSAIGSATIKVLPIIKVSIALTNTDVEFRPIECEGGQQEGIREDTADVVISFFDASNNPIDVTSYGLKVKYKSTFTDNMPGGGSSSGIDEVDATGSIMTVRSNVTTHYRENNCSGVNVINYDYTFAIEPGDGYSLF